MRALIFAMAALWTAASLIPECLAQETAPAAQQTTAAAPKTRPLHQHPALFTMLQRSNHIRRQNGLLPHRMNPILCLAAQDQARYMARTGEFDHWVNDGPQWRARKYGFRTGVWEILAMNGNSMDGAFRQWVASPAHYEAMLQTDTTDAGFGYAVSGDGWGYFVGVYGSSTGEAPSQSEDELAAMFAAEKEAAEKATAVQPASATSPTSTAAPAAAQ
jgi:uncharacterized protein YkwD